MSSPEPIEELLRIAKRAPCGESSRADGASFRAFEERLEQQRAPRRRMRVALSLSGCALLAATAWFVVFSPASGPLHYQIERSAVATGGQAETSKLSFSDGSNVLLGADSRAHVQSTHAHGAKVVLSKGSLDAAIVPRRGNDWWFEAGPYRVHVLGTAFAIQWSPDRGQFQIRVRSGKVMVEGPLAERGIAVARGQQLAAVPAQNRLEVGPMGGAEPMKTAVADTRAEQETGAARETPATATRSQVPPARREPRKREQDEIDGDYARWVAEGKFAEVVQAAQQAGVARVLKRASQSSLAALADAARYQGEQTLSRRALMALRARFADTRDGHAAAYFLGRISRDAQAAHWYRTYLKEQPDGSFAAPAWGALMKLQAQVGDTAAAARSAQAYLRLEPHGPHAPAARALIASQPASSHEGSERPR